MNDPHLATWVAIVGGIIGIRSILGRLGVVGVEQGPQYVDILYVGVLQLLQQW
jgi:hypothetical protein